MITIAEKIKAILDIKADMKDVINTLGGSANDDFSLYPAEIEKLEIESIMKLLAAATNNFTSYELLYSSTPMTEINCDGWKNKLVTSCCGMFKDMPNVVNISLKGFLTPNVVNMAYMYSGCPKLFSLDISSLDTSKVEDMSYMYYNDVELVRVIGDIDCSNLVNAENIVKGCVNLRELSLVNIYANSTMSDNASWSIDLSDTMLTDECLINIINQLPDLSSKGISDNTNIKLSLPINNTLTSDNIKVATDKGWIVVNINNKSNVETTSNNENEGGVVSE